MLSYNITQKAGNSGYYTLNKTTAKADDTITATLTEAGVQWLQDPSNRKCSIHLRRRLTRYPVPAEIYTAGEWKLDRVSHDAGMRHCDGCDLRDKGKSCN